MIDCFMRELFVSRVSICASVRKSGRLEVEDYLKPTSTRGRDPIIYEKRNSVFA